MVKLQNFYVRSGLFVALSLVGAALSYALYPALARQLKLSEFGDYVTIVGLSNQLMGILLAFSVISVALVKQTGESEASQQTQVIQKVLLWLFAGLSVVVLALSPLLQHILKVQHIVSFIILALIMVLAVPANIWAGYLQGHKEQVRVSLSNVCTAALKFVFVLLLAAPYGVTGGLWGFLLGSTLGLFILYSLPGKAVPKPSTIFQRLSPGDKKFLNQQKSYIAQSVFVVASIVFLQNYDLNRAKILFDPTRAGVYGGISVFSNALYFVLFLLIWILLPEFNAKVPSINKRVLRTAYLLISALTFAVVFGGLGIGNWLLRLALGDSFAHQGHTLVVASLYQIGLVSVAIYAFYLLIMRRRKAMLLSGSVLLCCLIIPLHFTSSPYAMISSLLVSVVIGVGLYNVVLQLRKAT